MQPWLRAELSTSARFLGTALKTLSDRAVHRAAIAYMRDKARVGLSIGVLANGHWYSYNCGTTKKDTAHLYG